MKSKIVILSVIIAATSAVLIYFLFFNNKYGWETGIEYTFAVDYKSSTEASFFMNQATDMKVMTGEMDCSLQMTVSPFEKKDKNIIASISFQSAGHCSFVMNNDELFKSREILNYIFLDRAAFAEIDPSGRVKNLFFKKDEDQVFISSVKLFLGDFQFIIRNGFSWKEQEKNQHGEYVSNYKKISYNPFSHEYTKETSDYIKINSVSVPASDQIKKITGLSEIIFRKGLVESFSKKENILIKNESGQTLFSLDIKATMKLTGTGPQKKKFSLSDMQKMLSSKLGTIELDERTRTEILKKAAKEMTISEFEKTLKNFSDTKIIYDKGQFIRRSVAYLKLHPEKCKDVYEFFIQKDISSEARVLAMGILSSAGHEEAQTAMRDVLKHENIKSDIYYSVYLQNFSVLKNPDVKTVEFIKNEFEQSLISKKNVTSSSLTLGAIAGKLNKNGKESEALEINAKLAALLKNSKNGKDKERFLDALGNTGIASNLKIAEGYVNDPNNRVRASLTNVVRFNQTKESEDFLFKLAQDKDGLVRMQAVNTLTAYDLKDEHIKKLNEYIKNDTFKSDDYLYLLQIYSKYENKKDLVKEALLEMKKRPTSNSHLRTTIENMLKQH